MSHDLAIQPRKGGGAGLLNELRGLIGDVRSNEGGPTPGDLSALLADLADRHGDDLTRIGDISDVLFGDELTAYGDRATAVFDRWAGEGGGPSLPALAAASLDRFDIAPDHPGVAALMISALLAEYPNTLLYHGNEHYRKVLFHTIRLIAANRTLNDDDARPLDDTQILQMLIAATIHDLGHEGGDNMRDGIYTPGYMEQKAVDIIRPYFDALGLDRDFVGDIETIVFCTDITFFAGDNSPCVRMKKIYRHYFTHDLPPEDDVTMMMMGKLRRFEDNPTLAMMAMMLHEADIGSSAGLTYEQSKAETIAIMNERGVANAGPKILLAFLRQQLDGRMMTAAGRALFGPAMAVIMEQAAEDVKNGVENF